MKSRLRIIGAVVVVALLVAGAVALFARGPQLFGLSFFGGASTGWFGPATFDGKPLTCPAANDTQNGQPLAPGVPEITPRIAHPGPQQAAYSAADVRAYLTKYPQWPASDHVTIYSIQLMNAVHAAALSQGECTGLPDGAPVYLVTLHGNFPAVEGPGPPPGPTATPNATVTATGWQVATMVYDAHTGNLIMTGNLGM